MPGDPLQKGEYREVAVGTGDHVYVEVIAEEIAFLVGVPAPIAVRLGIAAPVMADDTSLFLAATGPFFAQLCGGADRHTVTGKCQMGRINQTSVDGGSGRSLDTVLEESQGVFSPFFFPFGDFILGNWFLGERLSELPFQMREKLKHTDTSGTISREAAEDGIEKGLLKNAASAVMEVTFNFRASMQEGNHAGGIGLKEIGY